MTTQTATGVTPAPARAPSHESVWIRVFRVLTPAFASLSIITGAPAHRGVFLMLNLPDPGGPDPRRRP